MSAVLNLALDLVSLESVIGGDLLEPNAGDAYPAFTAWINGELHEVLTVLQRVVVYQVSGNDRACALFANVFVDPADIKPRQRRRPVSGWNSRAGTSRPIQLAPKRASITKTVLPPPRPISSLTLRTKLCAICGALIEVKANAPHVKFCGRQCKLIQQKRVRATTKSWGNEWKRRDR